MSQLRCRPGDLAVIVNALRITENIGKLVIVERLAEEGSFNRSHPGAVWVVRPASGGEILCSFGKAHVFFMSKTAFVLDTHLRPIRPNDGEDESLSWSKPLRREELA